MTMPFRHDDLGYALLDFGDGRKLERFAEVLVDRPSPVATGERASPARWMQAHGYYDGAGGRGDWRWRTEAPEPWRMRWRQLIFQLKPTPFGHLGVFSEQAANWAWLMDQAVRSDRPMRVLHLFAYTGGSTLAAAAAGAEVTHVDAAANVVAWARGNAELSGLRNAPIRWICDDAQKFVRREVRRGNRYDAVILDPPSFGRGPKSERWSLLTDLPELLEALAVLTESRPSFILFTCHSPALDLRAARRLLGRYFPDPALRMHAESLGARDAHGRWLPAGIAVRAQRSPAKC